jgi:hypothetical protein
MVGEGLARSADEVLLVRLHTGIHSDVVAHVELGGSQTATQLEPDVIGKGLPVEGLHRTNAHRIFLHTQPRDGGAAPNHDSRDGQALPVAGGKCLTHGPAPFGSCGGW